MSDYKSNYNGGQYDSAVAWVRAMGNVTLEKLASAVRTMVNGALKSITIGYSATRVSMTMTKNDGTRTIPSITGATQAQAGVMTAEDKKKLDSLGKECKYISVYWDEGLLKLNGTLGEGEKIVLMRRMRRHHSNHGVRKRMHGWNKAKENIISLSLDGNIILFEHDGRPFDSAIDYMQYFDTEKYHFKNIISIAKPCAIAVEKDGEIISNLAKFKVLNTSKKDKRPYYVLASW